MNKVSAALVTITAFFGGVSPETNPQRGMGEELTQWGGALPQDPRVRRELDRFRTDGGFGRELSSAFAGEVRSRIFSAALDNVDSLAQGECVPFTEVRIGDLDWGALNGVLDPDESVTKDWESFLKSLIRTEMVACLQTDSEPEEILRLYVSPEFRMTAEDRIAEMWVDAEGSCMETKGAYGLVDPTRICNRIHEFSPGPLAAQHSQVVFNQGEGPFQDAYFKESLKTFVRTGNGVAFHYINYTRAADLGRIERWVGAGKIKDSQEGTVEELKRWLQTMGLAIQ